MSLEGRSRSLLPQNSSPPQTLAAILQRSPGAGGTEYPGHCSPVKGGTDKCMGQEGSRYRGESQLEYLDSFRPLASTRVGGGNVERNALVRNESVLLYHSIRQITFTEVESQNTYV